MGGPVEGFPPSFVNASRPAALVAGSFVFAVVRSASSPTWPVAMPSFGRVTPCCAGWLPVERLGPRVNERAYLLNDLGRTLRRAGLSGAHVAFQAAGSRFGGDNSFLALLARSEAYSDPVRKKSLFFGSIALKECDRELETPTLCFRQSTTTSCAAISASAPSASWTRICEKGSSARWLSASVKTPRFVKPFNGRTTQSRSSPA
jgi:hypothetical protein